MNSLQLGLTALMILNMLWFGAGAVYFGLRRNAAAKLLVAREARDSSIEHQARFAIEVVKAIAQKIDAGRTAIRLSPGTTLSGTIKVPKVRRCTVIWCLS